MCSVPQSTAMDGRWSCNRTVLDTSCLACGNLRHVGAPETVLLNMLSLPNSCDIEFIVEGERFPAHRVVVAAVSAPFKKLLMGGMKESTSKEIHIKDITKSAWALVLKFIYSGKLIIQNKEDAFALARFADMYEMQALIHTVEIYFAENFQSLFKEDGLKLVPFQIIKRLTSNMKLKVTSEIDVLKWILAWANLFDTHGNHYDMRPNENIEPTIHEELKELLHNVKVEAMEPWEIEEAWSFKFVRNYPKIVDALIKRSVAVYEKGKDYFGLWHVSNPRDSTTVR